MKFTAMVTRANEKGEVQLVEEDFELDDDHAIAKAIRAATDLRVSLHEEDL